MKNRTIDKIKNLIDDFVDEKENRFCEMVYGRYYAYLADSFSEAVSECCNVTVFGREYSISPRELYDYDRNLAINAWDDHVDTQFGDFRDWVNEVVHDDLEDFTNEFQRWLAEQDDEWVADVAVVLLNGEIDLTKIVTNWLYKRLRIEAWNYPEYLA